METGDVSFPLVLSVASECYLPFVIMAQAVLPWSVMAVIFSVGLLSYSFLLPYTCYRQLKWFLIMLVIVYRQGGIANRSVKVGAASTTQRNFQNCRFSCWWISIFRHILSCQFQKPGLTEQEHIHEPMWFGVFPIISRNRRSLKHFSSTQIYVGLVNLRQIHVSFLPVSVEKEMCNAMTEPF